MRLRWLLGLERWPDWSWLLIGAAMLIIGLFIMGLAILALAGVVHLRIRGGAWSLLGLVFLGGAFANAGWAEASNAVSGMREKGGG